MKGIHSHNIQSDYTQPSKESGELLTLRQWMNRRQESLPQTWIQMARSITASIGKLHQQHKLHLALHPELIAVTPDGRQAELLDHGLAASIQAGEGAPPAAGSLPAAALPYCSPENTGRMTRTVDERSDLYSLGVLLYELLAGHRPFEADDPLEWVYKHLTHSPPPLHKLPLAEELEPIIMKLLEKNPDRRYASAAFLLAELDKIGRPQERIAAKRGFHGREQELALLSQAFHSVCLGSSEIVHICGAAGIGKTSLMEELFHRHQHERPFYYIVGKFDPLSTDSPYRPLMQAFRGLMRHILGERNEQVEWWRERLRQALGSGAGVIAEMIPETGLLLGTVPEVEELPAHESKKRFVYTFRKFVQALASREYPLVLFVDDLQWADASSLQLIHALVSDSECQYVLLVCAYRDSYVRFRNLPGYEQDGTVAKQVMVHHLQLEPLQLEEMNRIMMESLQQPEQATLSLTELLHHQSGGNPFHLEQLIRRLQDDRILSYNDELRCWQWNLGQWLENSPGYTLHELVEHKLMHLPPLAQELLRIAACLGTSFHPLVASLAAGLEEEESRAQWDRLEAEGLIMADEAGLLRLAHDNIQKLVYQNMDHSRRQALHLAIGRLLNGMEARGERLPAADWSERLYDAVNHLNRGAELIKLEEERLELIKLNLKAGQRAKATSAYDIALGYFAKGTELAGPVYWEQQFELMFELHAQQAECAYLCGHAVQSGLNIKELLERARTPLERSRIQMILITQLINQGKYLEGTRLGLQSLKELDVIIPADPGGLMLAMEIKRTELLLRKGADKLEHMEEMTDQERIAAMNLLFAVIPSTFFTDKKLFFLLVCRAVQLSLKYGSTPATTAIYSAFSMLLDQAFQQPEQAYALCKTGVELSERYGVASVTSKTYTMLGGVLCQFAGDAREGDRYLQRAAQLGMESGDYVFASFAAGAHVNSLYTRAPLDELARTIADYMAILDTTNDEFVRQNFYLYQQHILALKGRTEAPDSYNSVGFDEEQYVSRIRKEETSSTSLFQYHTYKVQLYYLLGRYEEARYWAEQASRYESYATHLPHLPECRFYGLLAAMSDSGQSRGKLREIKRELRRFLHWTRWGAANYRSRYELLQAEYARLQGETQAVEALYDQALREAREHGHLHVIALASERAARYYQAAGKLKTALFYLETAMDSYAQWGLEVKLSELRGLHSQWSSAEPRQQLPARTASPQDSRPTSALLHDAAQLRDAVPLRDAASQSAVIAPQQTGGAAEALSLQEADLTAILRTTQAITNSMDLYALLNEVLRTILQYAGASKGALLTVNKDRLYVQAYANGTESGLQPPAELEDSLLLPEGIIRYVYRTQEDVHYSGDGGSWLSLNPYFAAQRPQSALCIPVQVHGAALGVLYLENELAKGLFPPERRSVLLAMASHALFICMLQHTHVQESMDEQHEQHELEVQAPMPTNMMEEPLTDRELEVLTLLAKGLSNKEIAEQLIIAVGTVKVHVKNIFAKLKVNRRMSAVAQAKELRLLKEGTRGH